MEKVLESNKEPEVLFENELSVFYTNIAQVRVNPHDLEILFGRVDEVEPVGKDEIVLHSKGGCKIIMTFSLAEIIKNILDKALEQRKEQTTNQVKANERR